MGLEGQAILQRVLLFSTTALNSRMSNQSKTELNTPTAQPETASNAQQGIFLTKKELKSILKVSGGTIEAWMRSGWLPFIKLPGRRRVIFHKDSVTAALLRQQRNNMEAA